MEYQRTSKSSAYARDDDWDLVHNQLIEVQQKNRENYSVTTGSDALNQAPVIHRKKDNDKEEKKKEPSKEELDAELIHTYLNHQEMDLLDFKKQMEDIGKRKHPEGKEEPTVPEIHYKGAPDFIGVHSILEGYRHRPLARFNLKWTYKRMYDEKLVDALRSKLSETDFEITEDMMMTRRKRRNKDQNPEGLSREDWTKKETTRATRLVEVFEKEKSTPSFFSKISKDVIVKQLRERLGDPDSINQKNTWLCGPSACSHVILNYDPYSYTQIIIDLYKYGRSFVFGTLRASETMSDATVDGSGVIEKSGKPDRSDSDKLSKMDEMHTGLAAVDYILIGSLRRTANRQEGPIKNFKKYDPRGAFDLESGTLPWEIEDMLENLYGFTVLESGFWWKPERIRSIQSAVAAGKPVILFINHELSNTGDKRKDHMSWDRDGLFGVHYVVIDYTKKFEVTADDRVKFTYWDYGGSSTDIDVSKPGFRAGVKGYWIIEPKYQQ